MIDPDGLTETLVRALRERAEYLNGIDLNGEHPIEVRLYYHPAMNKVDLEARVHHRAPSVRPRRRPAADRDIPPGGETG